MLTWEYLKIKTGFIARLSTLFILTGTYKVPVDQHTVFIECRCSSLSYFYDILVTLWDTQNLIIFTGMYWQIHK